MKFTMCVQAFSNINRIVKFHIDMKLEDKHKLRPDNILTCEFHSETNNTADETQRNRSTSQQESELLKDAVVALMDLYPAQRTQDNESDECEVSETDKEEYNTDDSLVKLDLSYCSEDSSKLDSLKSDDDLDEEFYNIERLLHKHQLAVPEQEIYIKIGLLLRFILKFCCHLVIYKVYMLVRKLNRITKKFQLLYIKIFDLVRYVLQITQFRKEV